MGRVHGGKKTTTTKKDANQQTDDDEEIPSVHRRNVHAFAQPVILVFALIRFIAFQLWLLLALACRAGSSALPVKEKNSKISISSSLSWTTSVAGRYETVRTASAARPMFGELQLSNSSASSFQSCRGSSSYIVGPVEPVLVKQKQHHRKAFEHISKALRLDEEDRRGNLSFLLLINCCSWHTT